GLVRLAVAGVGGARLLAFLPDAVLAGFTAGAGVLIGIMQLDEALGMGPFRGGGLWSQIWGFQSKLAASEGPALPAVIMTLTTVSAVALGRRFLPRWPIALAMIMLSASVTRLFDTGLQLVRDRANVPSGWPPGALPSLDPALWAQFFLPALAIAFLGTLELTVCSRTDGARPDMRKEILAQGWANIVGAFASTFPASASLTRSALLKLGGAKTRMAAAFAALMVVPILFFGGAAVGYIPQAALAGVLLLAATHMVKGARLAAIWRVDRANKLLFATTFVSTLALPLELAIIIGCSLKAVMHFLERALGRRV
ncbi:MAG: solute carrier family 23 protein, partial [Myxococcota bacterium]